MNPPLKDALFRISTAGHVNLYRWTGGWLGGQIGKVRILLLTTTGRRSGRPRTTPLNYLADGDRLVLVASFGGDDRMPQWYRNLTVDPEVAVQIGTETRRMRAATASPEEKEAYWPRLVEMWPSYADYQRRTTREIPLVILSPAGSPAGGDVRSVIERFNAAWNAHDLDAALELVTDDCIFDNTGPAPDGRRHQGKEALRAAWAPVFDNEKSHFDTEELTVLGDRAVVLWRYDWGSGHVRGVDVFRMKDGLIAEKLSYVKG